MTIDTQTLINSAEDWSRAVCGKCVRSGDSINVDVYALGRLVQRLAELKRQLAELQNTPCTDAKEEEYGCFRAVRAERHLAECQKDAAFYKCCALSGEIPTPGAEPSAIAAAPSTEQEGK